MSGELKVRDYWFLSDDIHLTVTENEGPKIEMVAARHHYRSYRSWRTLTETVDGHPVSQQLLTDDTLPSDEFGHLLWNEQLLAQIVHGWIIQ